MKEVEFFYYNFIYIYFLYRLTFLLYFLLLFFCPHSSNSELIIWEYMLMQFNIRPEAFFVLVVFFFHILKFLRVLVTDERARDHHRVLKKNNSVILLDESDGQGRRFFIERGWHGCEFWSEWVWSKGDAGGGQLYRSVNAKGSEWSGRQKAVTESLNNKKIYHRKSKFNCFLEAQRSGWVVGVGSPDSYLLEGMLCAVRVVHTWGMRTTRSICSRYDQYDYYKYGSSHLELQRTSDLNVPFLCWFFIVYFYCCYPHTLLNYLLL